MDNLGTEFTDAQIYQILKSKAHTVIEECDERSVLFMFVNDRPLTIVYHPNGMLKKGHVYRVYTNWCMWKNLSPPDKRWVNFFILMGTLSANKSEQNDEIPLYLGALPSKVQEDIMRVKLHKAFALGVIRFFLKKYTNDFIWRPVMPSGRIGLHVRKGLEECGVEHPEFVN